MTKARHILAGCFLLLLLFLAGAASAQSRSAVGLSESFTVGLTPPSAAQQVKGLRLYLDGVKVGQDIPIPASGDVLVTVPGITSAGAHQLTASAFNDGGETLPADRTSLTFWVGPPSAPGLRIETTTKTVHLVEPQSDGTVKLRLESVETSSVVR